MGRFRNNNPHLEDVDNLTAQAFAKVAGVPMPIVPSWVLSLKEKKKVMDVAMGWLRNNDPNQPRRRQRYDCGHCNYCSV
jgi:hypothetical protein